MVTEVRSITSRSVRRRGMKPLVEAVVADATGTMKATFFNQPWLERKYRPGTRLLLQGKYQARNRFRVSFHAPTGEAVGASDGEMATYPATDGLSSTQILALAREHRAAARETLEPLPARLRVLERLPDRAAALDAAHFGDHEGGRRRLAFEELLLLQVALLRRRARRREGARAEPLEPPGELTRRWLADSLPFTPTDDQRHAMETVDADLAARSPDAAAADGGGGLGQDRRRALRDAARGRGRRPGGADGADRDARRAALRDAPEADAGRARPGRAADRLDARRAPEPTCSASSPPASCGCWSAPTR